MASSSWKNDSGQRLTHGYIREHNINLKIPEEIIKMIVTFLWYLNDYFVINESRSFKYVESVHKYGYHIFGAKSWKRNYNKTVQWTVKTDEHFSGRIGVIDDTKDYYEKVIDGKTILSAANPNTIGCGSRDGFWPGVVYGEKNHPLGDFIKSSDTITVDIDFTKNEVSFRSEVKNESVTISLKEEWIALRLLVEFGAWGHSTVELI